MKETIKSVFTSIFFTSIVFGCFSQSDFEITFNSEAHDEYCSRIVSSSTGNSFFILWKGNVLENYIYETDLYKVNSSGDTLMFEIIKQDTILQFEQILLDCYDDIIIAGNGWCKDESGGLYNKFQWFAKISQDLNLVWEKTYHIQNIEVNIHYSGFFELSNSEYIYLSSFQSDTNFYSHFMYLFKFSFNGDSIYYKLYDDNLSARYNISITYNQDSSDLYFHTYRADNPYKCPIKVLKVNSAFDTINTMYYPVTSFSCPFTTKLNKNGYLYSSGKYSDYTDLLDPNRYMRIIKFDSELSVEAFIDLTYPDPDKKTIPAWNSSIDFHYSDHIFVGCMYNNPGSIFSSEPSYIYLACLDENLNLKHEQYIGGDISYHLHSVSATSDGGVIISGSKYDYQTQENERDGYIMKFDSVVFVGLSPSSVFDNNDQISVYPNPCNDFFTLRNEEESGAFQLYNSVGKEVLYKKIDASNQQINISMLNCGIYIWIFRTENSTLFHGKIIKLNK